MTLALLSFDDDGEEQEIQRPSFVLEFDDYDDEDEYDDEDDEDDDDDGDEDEDYPNPGEVFLASRVIAATRDIFEMPEDDRMLEFTDPRHPDLVVMVHIAARPGQPVDPTIISETTQQG